MAADKCFAVAIRAALRAFPLMILYSEGINSEHFSIKPFGFWTSERVKLHLLAVMRSHCLGIFLVHEKLPFYNLFLNIGNALSDARSDADVACEEAKKGNISFSSTARSNAFIAANFAAFHAVDCSFSIFPCIDTKWTKAQDNFIDSIECAALVSVQASSLYSAAAHVSRSAAGSERFEAERAELIDASASAAARASTRFKRVTSFAFDVSADPSINSDASSVITTIVDVGTAASEAFAALSLHAHARNLTLFTEALVTAISAADAYERARLATLAFNLDLDWDMYVDIEANVYESARKALDINFHIAFDETADAADTMIRVFKMAAESKENYDNVRLAFDIFRVKYECLYNQNSVTAERIYDAAWRATFIAFDAFLVVEHDEKHLNSLTMQNAGNFNDETHPCATDAVLNANRAFNADVAAYSRYNIRAAREMFEQSFIEDVKFLKTHSASQLLEQPIWLMLDSNVEFTSELKTISQTELDKKAMWKNLWQAFKQEVLALDPDFNIWLVWYDELFAGNPIKLKKICGFLESSFEIENAADS